MNLKQCFPKKTEILPLEKLLEDPGYIPWTFGEKPVGPVDRYPGVAERLIETINKAIKRYEIERRKKKK